MWKGMCALFDVPGCVLCIRNVEGYACALFDVPGCVLCIYDVEMCACALFDVPGCVECVCDLTACAYDVLVSLVSDVDVCACFPSDVPGGMACKELIMCVFDVSVSVCVCCLTGYGNDVLLCVSVVHVWSL